MSRPGPEAFEREFEKLTDEMATLSNQTAALVVRRGAMAARKHWARLARQRFPVGKKYFKHGEWREMGAYSRSVRSHMVRSSGPEPSAEAGCPSMPGLPHLLEFGHARVGGGFVNGIPHVEHAAEAAFDEMDEIVERTVREVFR